MANRRPDGVITQERIDEISMITGHYVIPESAFMSEDIPGQDRFVELPEDALRRIAQGWMCGSGTCLAMFRIPLTRCPACYAPTGPHHIMARDRVPGSDVWDDHRKDRENPEITPRLGRGPQSPDAWLAGIAGDRDVEQTSMSKLKKRR